MKNKIPGLNYIIFDQNKILHFSTLGLRNLDDGRHFDIDTVSPIASMTKSFVAAAVLALRDEQKLSLEDPISSYIPELKSLSEFVEIRVKDLLSMSSGLPDDNAWADRELARSDAEFTELFRQRPVMATEPGTKFIYSNYGYMLLGRLVSIVSGKGALRFVTERFIEPLGLNSTKWTVEEYGKEAFSSGYSLKDGKYFEERYLSSKGDGAVFGGLFSSLSDVANWVRFLWSGFDLESRDESILSKRSRREMQLAAVLDSKSTSRTRVTGSKAVTGIGYGFGLRIDCVGNRFYIGHTGGFPGSGSHMRWSRENKLGIATFSNLTYSGAVEPCAQALDLLVEGLPEDRVELSQNLKWVVDGLLSLSKTWDDTAAKNLFSTNVFLDKSPEILRSEIEILSSALKKSPDNVTCRALNKTEAEITISTGVETKSVVVLLAPLGAIRIQALEWRV